LFAAEVNEDFALIPINCTSTPTTTEILITAVLGNFMFWLIGLC
jgi:hypothetical protein